MLVKDQGIDINAVGAQKHSVAIVAAKNVKCTMATLKGLAEMGIDIKGMCETQANVMMYYTRYSENIDRECVKFLQESAGNDIKHADKNKMNILHYTMINCFASAEDIRFLVDQGADINAKMAQDIDMCDLVIYTQNMKNADFTRIMSLTSYLCDTMDMANFDLRKLVVIQQLLSFDKLLMCKLRHHGDDLTGKKELFQIPE